MPVRIDQCLDRAARKLVQRGLQALPRRLQEGVHDNLSFRAVQHDDVAAGPGEHDQAAAKRRRLDRRAPHLGPHGCQRILLRCSCLLHRGHGLDSCQSRRHKGCDQCGGSQRRGTSEERSAGDSSDRLVGIITPYLRGAPPHTPARSLAGPRHPAPLPRGRAVRAAVMRNENRILVRSRITVSRGAPPHTPARSLAGPRHPAPLPRGRAVRAAVLRNETDSQEPHNGLTWAPPHTPARSLAGPRHPAPLPRGRAVRAAVMPTRTA